MAVVNQVFIMTFTPAAIPQSELVGFTRMFSDRLAAKDAVFAGLVAQMGKGVKVDISAQLHSTTMHTPQVMQNTLAGWMKNMNQSFNPQYGVNFFVHAMKDPKGMENYVLFYFLLK
ncbi:MAG: hypothetical protein IPG80_17395 [Anaerolineales bacterium]|uniref:hypothetical protein n=1 Tax=Candidatus Villigracilis vicinus TaxID=3140679 RepID=UPI003136FDBC|nr:hypothetical protein [Anaerolineales bacterium]